MSKKKKQEDDTVQLGPGLEVFGFSQQELAEMAEMADSETEIVKVLLLDLDGTIWKPISGGDFAKHHTDYQLIPGMEELILLYKSHGYGIVIVTNQGGIAHGIKSMTDFEKEQKFLHSLFKDNSTIDLVLMCPFHEKGNVEPLNRRSLLRKPHYGMLVQLELELMENLDVLVDWDKSIMVGDMESDKQCADGAGVKFHWAKDFLTMEHTFE